MAEQAQLPVIASVRAAWDFFTGNWKRFAPAAGFAALGAFISSYAMVASNPALAGLGMGVAITVAVAYRAALLRFALKGEFPAPLGMKFSADEARLAAVALLRALFLFLVALAAFVPLLIVVGGVGYATGDPEAMIAANAAGDSAAAVAAMGPVADATLRVGIAATVCLMLFVYVRLCLSEPATIAEGRVMFVKTWPWTGGSFWRLLAAIVLTALPGMGGGFLLVSVGGALAQAGAGAAAALFVTAGAYVAALMGGMMEVGLLVFLYRGLRPPA